MSGGGFLSESRERENQETLARIRVAGGVTARFRCAGETTRIQDLCETGGYRLLLPASVGTGVEAVQINTGGGIAGGDKLRFAVSIDVGADVAYATQSAERIYRSNGGVSEIDVAIEVADDARLSWLPQETILYSGARAHRQFRAEIAGLGRLLLIETIVFGRIGSGEQMGVGELRDVWRIKRDGRLLFADTVRVDGEIGSLLARPAVSGGCRVSSFILLISPDAEERLAEVRGLLDTGASDGGASAWNGMLVVRLLAEDAAAIKADARRILQMLHGSALPRVWTT